MKMLESDCRQEKPSSLLGADQVFVNKILARNSSFSRSSRRFSCKLSSQVPFKWEIQPGKPRDTEPETTCIFPKVGSPPFTPGEEFSRPKVSSARKRVSFWKKCSVKYLKTRKDEKSSGVCCEHCSKGLQNPSFSNFDDELLTSSSSSVFNYGSGTGSGSSSGSSSLVLSTAVVKPRQSKIKRIAKGIMQHVF